MKQFFALEIKNKFLSHRTLISDLWLYILQQPVRVSSSYLLVSFIIWSSSYMCTWQNNAQITCVWILTFGLFAALMKKSLVTSKYLLVYKCILSPFKILFVICYFFFSIKVILFMYFTQIFPINYSLSWMYTTFARFEQSDSTLFFRYQKTFFFFLPPYNQYKNIEGRNFKAARAVIRSFYNC